jgi:hypothetical protein
MKSRITAAFQTLAIRPLAAAIGITFTLLSPTIRAEIETPILAVESSYPKDYKGTLFAVSDDGAPEQVSGFHYKDVRGTERRHTVEEVRNGMILVRALGKDLIKLRAKDFERTSGGQISLMFYREFLSGDDRRELRFTYHPEGAEWALRTDDKAGRDLFSQLYLKIKTGLFNTPTGVAEIRLLEQGNQIRKYNPTELPRAEDRQFLFLD